MKNIIISLLIYHVSFIILLAQNDLTDTIKSVAENTDTSAIEEAHYYRKTLLLYESNSKYGYVDEFHNVIVPAIFDGADQFQNSSAIVRIGNNTGTIDINGFYILPLEYSALTRYKSKYFLAKKLGKYGIIDSIGNIIVPILYQDYMIEHDGLLILKINDKIGLFDFNKLEWVIMPKYTNMFIHPLMIGGSYRRVSCDLIDPLTYKVIDSTYATTVLTKLGNILVGKDNKYGIVNAKNNIIVPIIYDYLGKMPYRHNFFLGKKNGKYGLLTEENIMLTDFVYDEIYEASDYLIVIKNSKYGLLDISTFQQIVPCIYQYIFIDHKENIFAKKDDLYGVIKSDGSVMKKFVYYIDIDSYGGSYKRIYKIGSKYGFYNEDCILEKAIYDNIEYVKKGDFESGYFITKRGDHKEILDLNGLLIADISAYDDAIVTDEFNIIVSKNKKYGIIERSTGNILVPLVFSNIVYDYKGRCYAIDRYNHYYEITFDDNKNVITQPLSE